MIVLPTLWSLCALFARIEAFPVAPLLRQPFLPERVQRRTSSFSSFSALCKTSKAQGRSSSLCKSSSNNDDNENRVEEYRNVATKILSNFMSDKDMKETGQQDKAEAEADPLAHVDFGAPKLSKKLDMETFAAVLDAELYEKEWFVTGNVNPIYFSDDFFFQDPDVKLEGIEAYARGVNKLFDQETSRAEIISTLVNPELGENVITCTWRLSGYAKIGPGLKIKPYIVYTDFRVNPDSGLVEFQEDRFDIPSWDILLSSFFPFLVGKITSPPAPPVQPRDVHMPKI